MQQAMKHRKTLEPVWNDLDTFDNMYLWRINGTICTIARLALLQASLSEPH